MACLRRIVRGANAARRGRGDGARARLCGGNGRGAVRADAVQFDATARMAAAAGRVAGARMPRVRAMCRALRRLAAGGQGQISGLPKQEDLLQPAEQAGQARHDQGMQCIRQPATVLLRARGGAEAGELGAQRG